MVRPHPDLACCWAAWPGCPSRSITWWRSVRPARWRPTTRHLVTVVEAADQVLYGSRAICISRRRFERLPDPGCDASARLHSGLAVVVRAARGHGRWAGRTIAHRPVRRGGRPQGPGTTSTAASPAPQRPAKLRTTQQCYVCMQPMVIGTRASWGPGRRRWRRTAARSRTRATASWRRQSSRASAAG